MINTVTTYMVEINSNNVHAVKNLHLVFYIIL
jgi:hypothetical protein